MDNTKKEVRVFFEKLCAGIHKGQSMEDALHQIADEMKEDPIADVVKQIYDDIRAGSSLANALGKHPSLFHAGIVALVQGGETVIENCNLEKTEFIIPRILLLVLEVCWRTESN